MKKPKKRRELLTFPVARVFPPDDALAVDLLRLMAFHDDLSFIVDMMMQTTMGQRPRRDGAQRVAASRWFFLQRLFGAVVAELVKVVHNLEKQPRFAELRDRLTGDGREALTGLLALPFDEQHPIFGALYRARNKATFHFDPADFAAALRTLAEKFGPDATASFLREDDPRFPGTVRMHYMIPGQVALEASYGFQGGKPHAALGAASDLHRALTEFLGAAFPAYCQLRGIDRDLFRETVLDD
jgi:hypothetical protein